MNILVVTNLYPNEHSPSSGTFVATQIESIKSRGIEVSVCHVDRSGLGVRAYLKMGRDIRNIIKLKSPDIVHVMYGGALAVVASLSVRGFPVIVSFCGSDLLGEPLPGMLRQLMIRGGVWGSRYIASRAAHIIVKSRNLYDALPRSVDQKRITVLPNGVDLTKFRPLDMHSCRTRLGLPIDAFVIMVTSNNHNPRKRRWLSDAAISLIQAKGINACIYDLVSARHSDVPLWLNACNMVVLTSVHEGSPNIIKEALACNRPIVSVDVGDVAERVSGVDGCFVVEPNPEAIAEKMLEIYRFWPSTDGRKNVEELSLEKVADRLIGIYNKVLNDKGK